MKKHHCKKMTKSLWPTMTKKSKEYPRTNKSEKIQCLESQERKSIAASFRGKIHSQSFMKIQCYTSLITKPGRLLSGQLMSRNNLSIQISDLTIMIKFKFKMINRRIRQYTYILKKEMIMGWNRNFYSSRSRSRE